MVPKLREIFQIFAIFISNNVKMYASLIIDLLLLIDTRTWGDFEGLLFIDLKCYYWDYGLV